MPAIRKLWGHVAIGEIEKAAATVCGKEESSRKKVSVYLNHRYSGEKLKEIGGYFGLSPSGVTQASRRLEKKMEEDKTRKRKVEITKRRLKL